jgi:glyoxylase-like metal-dependent hydrolase (beta-lactamase superfamily II)
MKIADKIEILELPMKLMGTEGTIYPTVIWDDNKVILVDAGISDSVTEIKDAMDKGGIPFKKIDTIIVTHQDIDHIGGINNIIDELNDVKVLAHGEDKPYIQGEKKILRLNNPKIMDRINLLPEYERQKVLDMLENAPVKVDVVLADGDELSYCGGIMVIHTPGHTPGHICLYHKESKSLIVGDALNIENDELIVTHKEAMNKEELEIIKTWLKKIRELDVENVITYHAGLFNNNPNQKIKELIRFI